MTEQNSRVHHVQFRHSLRFRLPLWLCVLVAVMLGTFLWATYVEVERTLVREGHKRSVAAADQISDQLARALGNAIEQTNELSTNEALRAFLRAPTESNRAAALAVLERSGSRLRREELWDTAGTLLLEVATAAPDTAPGLKGYPVGQQPTQSGISHLQRAGEFTYFTIGAVIPDTSEALPPLGYVQRFGRITTSPSGMVKRLLGEEAMLKIGTIGHPVWTDFFTLVEPPPRAEPERGIAEHRASNGDRWLGGSSQVEGSPWVVWVGFPRAVVLEPIDTFIRRMATLALLFLFVSLLLALILGLYLTRPMRKLVHAAERLAGGDYSHRAEIHRRDEIGRLGQTFDIMADRIDAAYSALRSNNAQTHFSLATARIGVWESLVGTQQIKCSESMALVHGVAADALPRSHDAFLSLVHPDDRAAVKQLLNGVGAHHQRIELEYRPLKPDHTVQWVEAKARVSYDEHGVVTSVLGVSIDITERRSLETQLRQAQKMEAIGQLSGGIAHDFNNLLTAIVGHGNLMLSELPEKNRMRDDVIEILKAGESAAGLTRQLLSFSRQRVMQPEVTDVNGVIDHTEKLLRRLIGEKVTLECELAAQLATVYVDPGQLQQVLVNLAVNARDAMPEGGTLQIRTANVELDEAAVRRDPEVRPGSYVLLSIADNGTGMDATTQAHLFEPFFTTKPVGKGTGLGLATVFGIVKQSGGHIYVSSELGRGSRFDIYLPVSRRPDTRQVTKPAREITGGNEIILLVEDDDAVRAIATTILKRLGYRVLVASNGEDALNILKRADAPPDLLLTDVIMPGLNGPELYKRIAASHPQVNALFSSGYPGDALSALGLEHGEVAFIEKPYSPASLAAKVRETLNNPRPSLL